MSHSQDLDEFIDKYDLAIRQSDVWFFFMCLGLLENNFEKPQLFPWIKSYKILLFSTGTLHTDKNKILLIDTSNGINGADVTTVIEHIFTTKND